MLLFGGGANRPDVRLLMVRGRREGQGSSLAVELAVVLQTQTSFSVSPEVRPQSSRFPVGAGGAGGRTRVLG